MDIVANSLGFVFPQPVVSENKATNSNSIFLRVLLTRTICGGAAIPENKQSSNTHWGFKPARCRQLCRH